MPGEKCRSARQYEYYNTKTIKKDGKKQKTGVTKSLKKAKVSLRAIFRQYANQRLVYDIMHLVDGVFPILQKQRGFM